MRFSQIFVSGRVAPGALHLPLAVWLLLGCSCMAQVEQLTFGPDNDTEPCWSPDGQRIAFQTDRRGDLDIFELALAGGSIKEVAAGPGNACYQAYLPDGALAYVFGHHQGTAAQCAGKREKGYGLRLLRNGSETILTSGYWRDYTPSATQDGGMLYYASTQNVESEPVGVWKERVSRRRRWWTAMISRRCATARET